MKISFAENQDSMRIIHGIFRGADNGAQYPHWGFGKTRKNQSINIPESTA